MSPHIFALAAISSVDILALLIFASLSLAAVLASSVSTPAVLAASASFLAASASRLRFWVYAFEGDALDEVLWAGKEFEADDFIEG